MLHFKKKFINVISLRVTFPFKHVVGGREAHKIVGVELLVFRGTAHGPSTSAFIVDTAASGFRPRNRVRAGQAFGHSPHGVSRHR